MTKLRQTGGAGKRGIRSARYLEAGGKTESEIAAFEDEVENIALTGKGKGDEGRMAVPPGFLRRPV